MRTEFKIFLTIWIVYIFFLSDYGGNYMADSMLAGTMALVDNGNFEIDDYVKEGCKITGCDNSFYNGKIYPGYAPGNSVLAVPLYIIIKPFLGFFLSDYLLGYSKPIISLIILNIFATIFITAFLSALLAVLIYRFSENITNNKKERLWVTFIFAFGTLFFTYSTAYFSRISASFFLFCSFYLLFLMKEDRLKKTKKLLFLTGFLSAISINLDYSTILLTGLFFIYLISFFRGKKIIYYFIVILVPIILLMSYHYAVYDNPLKSSYQYHRDLNGQEYIAEKELNLPNLERLWGLSFSPEKGFFFFMPFMLLSFIGIFEGFRKKKFIRELILILSIFLVIFILNASLNGSWKGNCAFGPRHMLVVIPFLILPSLIIINKLSMISKILGVISIFINSLPAILLRTNGCELPNSIFQSYLPTLFEKGLSNYTINLIDLKLFEISSLYHNLIMVFFLTIIGLVIYFIWKK